MPLSIKVPMDVKREQPREWLLLHHLYRKEGLWKNTINKCCPMLHYMLILKKSSRQNIIFGFKNHFSTYTKNGWKTDAVYCLFQTLNLVSSYNPSVFLQHFFQKGEECEWVSLIPKLTYHTSISLHSSFLHTSLTTFIHHPIINPIKKSTSIIKVLSSSTTCTACTYY